MTDYRDKEEFERLYFGEDMGPTEIAEKYDVSRGTINYWREKHGIQSKRKNRAFRDEGTLRELYWDKRLSEREIAEELECSRNAVKKWMDEFGIERRDRAEAHKQAMWKKPASFTTNKRGYELIRSKANGEFGEVYHHRLIAIAEFGIEKVKNGIVHHRNGLKWDNRPENLEVKDSHSEHFKQHWAEDPDTMNRWG